MPTPPRHRLIDLFAITAWLAAWCWIASGILGVELMVPVAGMALGGCWGLWRRCFFDVIAYGLLASAAGFVIMVMVARWF